jgi:hypothetical protein
MVSGEPYKYNGIMHEAVYLIFTKLIPVWCHMIPFLEPEFDDKNTSVLVSCIALTFMSLKKLKCPVICLHCTWEE